MKQCTCYALRAVDCTCKPAKYGELYTSPTTKQEPMSMQMDVIVGNLVREGINKHRARELAEHFIKTSAPQQRTWVGLTDEDLSVCDEDGVLIARYWESRLKEKNT